MPVVTYEGMFLLDSNKYASNPQGVTTEVLGILERVGAKVLATRPWQDGKLAYSIEGHRKGLHFLVYFSLDSKQVSEIDRLVKFNETIHRHLLINLPPALVEPMIAMATGKGEVITTFRDNDALATATDVGAEAPGGRGRSG
ncbi:MAG: 30S ribosomal protein S6 [Planctomycetaceae bacterium]